MVAVSHRERSAEDDMRSVRNETSAVKSGDALSISIPLPREGPIVVWADSVQRASIRADDDVLRSCMEWPKSTEKKCHNCSHRFDGVPVPLPVYRDELRNIYHCSGNFCSWQCSKAFNNRETSPAGRGNRNMYISLLAYRLWVKMLRDKPSLRDNARSFCSYRIEPARPRFDLRDFGGNLTIEEYREGFFGVLPPEDMIESANPLVTLRSLAVVPFIDTNIAREPSAAATRKKKKNADGAGEGAFRGIKRIETDRVMEFSNSFCDRLKRARADPTLMRRKKARDESNTLLSSMGIKIRKRCSGAG